MPVSVDASIGRQTAVELTSAVLLYTDGSYQGDAFATVHKVTGVSEGTPALAPGQLLTAEGLRAILKALYRLQRLEVNPPHVLASSPERQRLVWFELARSRVMFFKANDTYLDALSGQSFPQPPLLFIAGAQLLKVFALGEGERPTGSSPWSRSCSTYARRSETSRVAGAARRSPRILHPNGRRGGQGCLPRRVREPGTWRCAWVRPTGKREHGRRGKGATGASAAHSGPICVRRTTTRTGPDAVRVQRRGRALSSGCRPSRWLSRRTPSRGSCPRWCARCGTLDLKPGSVRLFPIDPALWQRLERQR